mmetsp:Transcript_8237/g.21326  ORF Transcript_8237/g.21326 Transcript_8237/m.21326 type:complete len:309 (+) Transcript_8237:410-1336(+)
MGDEVVDVGGGVGAVGTAGGGARVMVGGGREEGRRLGEAGFDAVEGRDDFARDDFLEGGEAVLDGGDVGGGRRLLGGRQRDEVVVFVRVVCGSLGVGGGDVVVVGARDAVTLDLAGDVDGGRETGTDVGQRRIVGDGLGREAREHGESSIALAIRAEFDAVGEGRAADGAVEDGGGADARPDRAGLEVRLLGDALVARPRVAGLGHEGHEFDLEGKLGLGTDDARQRRRHVHHEAQVVFGLGRRVLVEKNLLLGVLRPIRLALVALLGRRHPEVPADQGAVSLVEHARRIRFARRRHCLGTSPRRIRL